MNNSQQPNQANTPSRRDIIGDQTTPSTNSPSELINSPSEQTAQRERIHDHMRYQLRRNRYLNGNLNRNLFPPAPQSEPPPPPNEEHDSEGTHSRLENLINNLTRRVEILESQNARLRNNINLLMARQNRNKIPSNYDYGRV